MEIFDEVSNVWEKYGTDTTPAYVDSWEAGGQNDCSWILKTDASLGSTYSPSSADPDIIYLRYKVYDPDSDVADAAQAIYDPFEITMNWECSTDSVTIAPSDDIGT